MAITVPVDFFFGILIKKGNRFKRLYKKTKAREQGEVVWFNPDRVPVWNRKK